jgi:hypothetical protein
MADITSKVGAIVLVFGFATPACVEGPEVGTEAEALSVEGEWELPATNSYGVAASVSSLGPIDFSNAFFSTEFSGNGRSCVPCHDPRAGWTISDEVATQLFDESDGLDPLFRIHDVGTRPDAETETLSDRKKAYSPMTDRGLVRFPASVPPAFEFEVIAVDDPYGFGTPEAFTRFRRPTATASEQQVVSITWTGGPHDIPSFLATLFGAATTFHGQGVVPPQEASEEAAAFMFSVFHAQAEDNVAGRLDADGARGGPVHLSQQEFFEGINSGEDFDPKVFDIYDAWLGATGDRAQRRRAAIARGQEIFNFKTFGNGATCSRCHNAPNVGSSSTFRMLSSRAAEPSPELRHVLPVITIRNKATGEVSEVTDFGRAASTGLWADVGRFRVPPLRGLAARAPYFHNGRARTLMELIKHYEDVFNIDFEGTERKDLEAFLSAL